MRLSRILGALGRSEREHTFGGASPSPTSIDIETARRGCMASSSIYLLALLAVVMLFAGHAQATSIERGDSIHLSYLHHIYDDFYAFGQNVTVDGFINGDLVVGAYEVFINGEVTESENVFAYKLHHTGATGNSLRAFANTVVIDGRVGRSVMLFAYEARIGKGAVVEQDVSVAGFTARIDGTVGGDATIRTAKAVISGEIGGDVDIEAEDIRIVPPAVIKGNLRYCCAKKVEIDTVAGVVILGETRWEQPEGEDKEEEEETAAATFRTVIFRISKILAAFLFGVIVVYLFRRHAEESFRQLRTRFSVSIATGVLSLLILVVALLILIVSAVFLLVGLALISGALAPLGALVLVLSMLMVPITAFTTVSGGIIFYSGKIMFAFLLGYLLARAFKSEVASLGKAQLLFGLIILALLFAVPFVGIVVYLLVSIAGAGAIVLGIRECRVKTDRVKDDSSVVPGRDEPA